MKNFNIDNFKLYAKWDLTLNQKFYRNIGFVYLFAILGIVLVSFFIRWFLYSVGYPSNIYSGVSITSLILHGLTTYALMISSGCVFHPLRNKQGRITNLTIPASSFEKYAWHLLICIIGTYVISFIGLVLADGMNALMTLAIFGADSIMSITVAWFDISRDMITLKGLEEMQLADQIIVEAAVFFGWSFTFLYWSIYTYGNSIKYKYNIPITYIATQLVGFVFAIIMISFGIRAGNNSEQMDEIMLNLKWFFNNIEYFLYAGGIVIICVTIVLYYISYKRYTRAELTNYMNK